MSLKVVFGFHSFMINTVLNQIYIYIYKPFITNKFFWVSNLYATIISTRGRTKKVWNRTSNVFDDALKQQDLHATYLIITYKLIINLNISCVSSTHVHWSISNHNLSLNYKNSRVFWFLLHVSWKKVTTICIRVTVRL